MRKSIYFRIFIATALIVLISLTLLGGLSLTLSYRRTYSENRSMMFATLRETTTYIAQRYVHHDGKINGVSLDSWLALTTGVTNFDVFVTDPLGSILTCSQYDPQHLGMILPENLIAFANSGEYGIIRDHLGGIYSSPRQIAAAPIIIAEGAALPEIVGYVFVTSTMVTFTQQWFSFVGAFIAIAVGVMVLAFSISFITARKQTEPVTDMADIAERFAKGEFDSRVSETNRNDEIGKLARAFNAMGDALEIAEQHKRDLVTNLSHELKTPMTVIAGFAEGLLDGTIPQDDEVRYLGVICSETRRMSRLVKSMLDVSTLDSTTPSAVLESSFDVVEVVRISLLSLGSKIETKNLDVNAGLPDKELLVRGDMDAITQVVYNLIDNAVKFSWKNSVLDLKVWETDSRVNVMITNRGETIPEEDLPLIFDRFHKADKSRNSAKEGVGLGLYIVKQILDNHGETITASSKSGVTSFKFSLRLSSPSV